MKKNFKAVLPSLFFVAFGISAMLIVSSCEKDAGSKCSKCSSDSDCTGGLKCFIMTNGSNRCLEKAGDLCLNI
jgi:hypothetical protein